tara:strand:+ start:14087 stop:14290 length:204 start_codon:yes stop_codon:yes gene_type:complete
MSLRKDVKNIEKSIKGIEKDFAKDVKYVERWVYERKRFFIKLGIVGSVVALFLIISRLYLRVRGVGI